MLPKLTEVFLMKEDNKNDIQQWAKSWNLNFSSKNQEAIIRFVSTHQSKVDSGIHAGDTEADYAMFVDDMEGLDLKEELEKGDFRAAEMIFGEIMKKYSPKRYSAFANDFQGSGPEGGGEHGN